MRFLARAALAMHPLVSWSSTPEALVGCAVIGVLAWTWLLRASPSVRRIGLQGLAATVGGYTALAAIGLYLRAQTGAWQPAWPADPTSVRPVDLLHPKRSSRVRAVGGGSLKSEQCLGCHATMVGFSAGHEPAKIGCAACHGGDRSAVDAKQAHRGLIRIPGNLSDAPRTCGQTGCHEAVVPRVERSIMTTMAGVIAVDRRAFAEAEGRTGMPPNVQALGSSPADSHVRQLCASCHLGQTKTSFGPVTEASRGGGCNACHLVYDAAAITQLAASRAAPSAGRTAAPMVHPRLSLAVDGGHCFGCHSRSSRISTSYEGWRELNGAPTPVPWSEGASGPPAIRRLEDGRIFQRTVPDVHRERGMDCIDCHTANELMGEGGMVAHKRDQVRIRCEDCHTTRFASAPREALPPETAQQLRLRGWVLAPGECLVTTPRGEPLSNVVVAADGTSKLVTKLSAKALPVRAPSPECRRGAGHARLSCESCHTAWAPRCVSCHTRFDPKADGFDHVAQRPVTGAWQETAGAYEAAPPTLGVVGGGTDAAHPGGVVGTFVPGMILTLARAATPGATTFQRRYARIEAHTTRREARSCQSCHNDPVALGFGEGRLDFVVTGATGRWRFTPAHERLPADGLPADAWVGFLETRGGDGSTRPDARPFTAAEQRRILQVGACLTCHDGDSAVMRAALGDFASTANRRSPRCAWPIWSR